MADETTLTFEIMPREDVSPEEHFDLVTRLRKELLDTNVDSVSILSDTSVPKSGKEKGDPVATGELVVTLASTIIPAILVFIQGWVLRQKDHSIRVKVGDAEVEIPRDADPDEINRIVEIVKNASNKKGV